MSKLIIIRIGFRVAGIAKMMTAVISVYAHNLFSVDPAAPVSSF